MFHLISRPWPRARTHRFTRALALLPLLAMSLFILASCRGGGGNGGVQAPGPQASPAEVSRYLSGNWRLSVQTSLSQGGLEQPPIPLSFTARQPARGGTAQVAGEVGGVRFDGGTLDVSGEQPAVSFTTGELVVPGATGETRVPGPLEWTGTLRGGRLEGQVTGADGRTTSWSATRADAGRSR